MPCILEILAQLESLPEIIVVDGYVELGSEQKPGLGKHLHDAIDGKSIIIGVAKNRFEDTPVEAEVFRGGSQRPLYSGLQVGEVQLFFKAFLGIRFNI